MRTAQELEAGFRAKLSALLAEFNADLTAEDHFQGYAECGEDVRMTVTMAGTWAENYTEQLQPYVEIDLGSSVWGSQSMLRAAGAPPAPTIAQGGPSDRPEGAEQGEGLP